MPNRHRPGSGVLTVRMDRAVISRWRRVCRALGLEIGRATQGLIEQKISELEDSERGKEKSGGGTPPYRQKAPGGD
jgi:hypothetical protein